MTMGDVSGSESFQRINTIIKTCVKDELVASYNKWADKYDEDVIFADHQGSIMMADELDRFYPPDQREGLRIIDIAAGTGRAGMELRRRGYTNIDALEPSPEMLEIARKHKLYQNHICAIVSDKKLDLDEGIYDAVCSVGAICKGHLPGVAIKEMFRLTKSGGIICIVGTASEWEELPDYHVTMDGLIIELQKQGKLKVLKKEIKRGYMFGGTANAIPGILYSMRKT